MDTAEEQNQFFQQIMNFGVEDIQQQFVNVVGEIAYFAGHYERENSRWLRAKTNRERTEAKVGLIVRQELIELNGKTTEKQVETGVTLHPEVQQAVNEEIEALANKERLKTQLQGCINKKEMLMSLGGFKRAEMEADAFIKQKY